MVLLAAFQILLHRYSGQDEVIVGSPISARSRAEFAAIVGCFFNAVVLRADFFSDRTFTQFLDQVRAKVLGALDHQAYPSQLLVEQLQPVRDPSRPPLFQVTFILQSLPRHSKAITFGKRLSPETENGLVLNIVPVERRHARMELELEMIEANQYLYAWLHYNRDLFDAASIARMADHFQVLLEGIIANPDQRLSKLPILTNEEIEHLLSEQNSESDFSEYLGIEELFLTQAKRAPEKIAAVYTDTFWTFDELNKQSNRLANLIRALTK
jgi:non-ribosomal peptide synthetase component F